MTTVNFQKLKICELNPEIKNAIIVGIIIAKRQPHLPNHRRDPISGGEEFIWNFVIRDAPFYTINVICWGSENNLIDISKKFQIGDVVNIITPEIEMRDFLCPHSYQISSSLHNLNLRGDVGTKIVQYKESVTPYLPLLRFIMKPISSSTTNALIQNFKNAHSGVDVFGAVRLIGNIDDISTCDGVKPVREIVLVDQSSIALRVNILDPDLIERAKTWKISVTVLFIINVVCEWSDYTASINATVTPRSILTEDPLAPETTSMKKHISRMNPLALIDTRAVYAGDILSIKKIMKVCQVKRKADNIMATLDSTLEEQQFTALVFAVVTSIDFAGVSRMLTLNCSRCNILLGDETSLCPNNKYNGIEQDHTNTILTFDVRIMLSDQTGSLYNCRLCGATAERVLNCSVQQYIEMSDEEKSTVENKLLMELCSLRLHVMAVGFQAPTISILTCELASPRQSAHFFC